jgi:hypothetical protein
MDPDLLTLRMDWGGLLQVPVASLSRLDVKNGRLVYLTDLRPSEIRETPFLDGSFPMQMDRAVSGRPLRLGGRTYSRGLGMHSRCEATFALDGGFATFEATIGVDDGVAPRGSVIFRVYADQNPKPSFESRVMRGGDRPEAIRVPIRGVLLLRLEADYADQGDVADHANWADARLLRP